MKDIGQTSGVIGIPVDKTLEGVEITLSRNTVEPHYFKVQWDMKNSLKSPRYWTKTSDDQTKGISLTSK